MADQKPEDVPQEEKEMDLSVPDVVTKYTAAGEIAKKALAHVVAQLQPGKSIVEICAAGDAFIREECSKIYKSAKFEKGIAFPTCVSVDHCCGHFSPLEGETVALEANQLAKVDMGVHIDGFIALVAHTHQVGATTVTGRQADALAAANTAAEVAIRAIKPGAKNHDVTALIEKTVKAFDCNPVEGVVSHQLRKLTIDGEKCIMSKNIPEKRIPECTFEANEVYAIDIVVSTGEGKARELESRTTVFKRSVDASYGLKLKAARQLYHDIKEKHPHMPFSLRDFDGTRAKMGVVECVKHDLLQPYPVLYEREGEYVAQIKFTALLLPGGALRVSGHELQAITTDKAVEDEEIKTLLATEVRKKKEKKAKK